MSELIFLLSNRLDVRDYNSDLETLSECMPSIMKYTYLNILSLVAYDQRPLERGYIEDLRRPRVARVLRAYESTCLHNAYAYRNWSRPDRPAPLRPLWRSRRGTFFLRRSIIPLHTKTPRWDLSRDRSPVLR